MSNPNNGRMDPEEEIVESSDDSDITLNDEGDDSETVPEPEGSESPNMDEIIRNQAVVAAQLILAAAEEAAGRTGQIVSENPKKLGRPRVLLEAIAGASGSNATGSTLEGEPMKKARKRGTFQLNHHPKGPHKCNICGKCFLPWNPVFGHLACHKNREYQSFFPPPIFNAAEEGFVGTVAASSGGDGFGVGTAGRLRIDLNANPMEVGEGSGSGSKPRFDLNRSPPKEEEEEEEKENKEDKAE